MLMLMTAPRPAMSLPMIPELEVMQLDARRETNWRGIQQKFHQKLGIYMDLP